MNKKLNIIKRDGNIVEFNKEKIENAIIKAIRRRYENFYKVNRFNQKYLKK